MCCHDQGLIGGGVDYEYRYCLCPAGRKRKAADIDGFIEGLNAQREKMGIGK